MTANRWFADTERIWSASTIANGNAIAGLLIVIFVKAIIVPNPSYEDGFRKYLFVQNIFLIFFAVLGFIFIKSRPEHPPSIVA